LYIWIDGVHNNGAFKLSVRGGRQTMDWESQARPTLG
jgi:hypothetical protein